MCIDNDYHLEYTINIASENDYQNQRLTNRLYYDLEGGD